MGLSEADIILILRIESSLYLPGYLEAALDRHTSTELEDLRQRLQQDGLCDEEPDAVDFAVWDSEEEHKSYRQVAQGAVFLSVWAAFELAAAEYLEAHVALSRTSPLRVRDLRGGTLEAMRAYVEKILGHEFDLGRAQWSDITRLRQLRNHLAHQSVALSGCTEKVRRVILSIPGVALDHRDQVSLEPRFWQHTRSTLLAFASELTRAANPSTRTDEGAV